MRIKYDYLRDLNSNSNWFARIKTTGIVSEVGVCILCFSSQNCIYNFHLEQMLTFSTTHQRG